MNRFFQLLLALACLSCNEVNKTKTVTQDTVKVQNSLTERVEVREETDPIAAIRKIVTHINTTRLEKKHFELMCDVATKVDFFYANKEIVKISIDFGTLGDVYAREDYYYDKGQLIFFYEFVEGGPACEGCIKTDEYRSYIKDGKVFKHLKNKDVQPCRKCEFGPSSRQYKLLSAKNEAEVKKIVCNL